MGSRQQTDVISRPSRGKNPEAAGRAPQNPSQSVLLRCVIWQSFGTCPRAAFVAGSVSSGGAHRPPGCCRFCPVVEGRRIPRSSFLQAEPRLTLTPFQGDLRSPLTAGQAECYIRAPRAITTGPSRPLLPSGKPPANSHTAQRRHRFKGLVDGKYAACPVSGTS